MQSTISYKVRKGDTLIKIAKMHFIADWNKEIWQASFNKDLQLKTKSPDYIQAGWVIKLPVISMRSGEIYQPVGAGKAFNRPEDVVMVKGLLNKHAADAGFKVLAMNGKADQAFVDAIKFFQTAKGLPVSGLVAPKGKTLSALSKAPSKN